MCFNTIWELWQSCSIFCISIQTKCNHVAAWKLVWKQIWQNWERLSYTNIRDVCMKHYGKMLSWWRDFKWLDCARAYNSEEKCLRCDFIWFGSWEPQGTVIVSVTCSSWKDCSTVRLISWWLKKIQDFCYSLAAVLNISCQHRQVCVTNIC